MYRVTPPLCSLMARLIVRSATTAMTNANVFLQGGKRDASIDEAVMQSGAAEVGKYRGDAGQCGERGIIVG